MISFLEILFSTGLSFLLLSIIFIPLERVYPAHAQQKLFRPEWLLDLMFFLGQYFIWSTIVLFCISFLENTLNQYLLPKCFLTHIWSQAFWVQCIEVIFLSDILIYWAHRLQHQNAFLWRFHKVHHSAKHLDWLASHREHPFDTLYTITIINLPAILLGFPLQTLSFLVLFRGVWAIYIHSNININIGFLKYIIGSPNLHHWHHDQDVHKGNYANISPLMDLIFGTFYEKKEFPITYGLKEESPKYYLGHIIQPLLWKKKEKQ